ncbi:MAG: hypothetical protein RBT60_12655 [Candidatus Krumholzibacteria bacterium]|jgi:hypothetical protein|nr:hypothetical protein [Candidatus Krumholzibacteria bacterium]
MRFLLPLAALMFTLVLGAAAPGPANASDFSAGLSLADFDDLGVQARWLRPFVLRATDLSTGVTYFVDGEYLAFDGDLHFHLADPSLQAFYGLVGLSLATDFDDTDLDLNLGVGYNLNLGRVTKAALEGKFIVGDADMFVATFSIFF